LTSTVAVSPTASASKAVPAENRISPLSIVSTPAASVMPLITALLLDTVTDPSESSDRTSPMSTSVSFATTSNDIVWFSPAAPNVRIGDGRIVRAIHREGQRVMRDGAEEVDDIEAEHGRVGCPPAPGN
jgi:hypothetical protein